MEDWRQIIEELKAAGVKFDPGLTDAQVNAVEKRYAFRFPPDLKAFLQTALPRGERFPDWRNGKAADLKEWFDIPRHGIVFDIENNNFWFEDWGPRPEALADRVRAAEKLIAAAPKLIPIYSHRMIAAEPHEAGNPVFSVHQTDIIYYGFDLEDYLRHEFKLDGRGPWPTKVRDIRFWDIERWGDVRWAGGDGCVVDNGPAR